MGLALPLALLGLVLAGAPILAHLVRRSDVPTRALPTVELLARALAESKRRVRVVDPLLLALRILLVATLALAVAAPFVESEVAYGNGALASVAVVVDDSMSMARRLEGDDASAWDRARERAAAAIRALPEGSEVAVVLAGRPARALFPRSTAREEALRALESAEPPGTRSTDLADAIAMAGRQLGGAVHADRRILVLSDFAGPAPSAGLTAPSGIRMDLEPIGPDATPNFTLASIDAAPDPTLAGSLSVAVVVRGFGVSADHVSVAAFAGTRELARTEVPLVDGAGRATLHVLPPDDATTDAEVRIVDAGDALPMDDARAFLLRPSSAVRVTLVDGDPRPLSRRAVASGGATTRFLAQALALAPHDGPRFVVRRTDVETYASSTEATDVVALADVDLAREDVARRTRAALDAGAGLLVAGGDHVRGGASALADRLPAHILGQNDTPRTGLFAGPAALATRDEGLARVQITRALALDAQRPELVALRFSDESPALVLARATRTALLALPLDDTGSDLPLHPGFLALSVELFRALAPEGAMPDEAVPPDALPHLVVSAGTSRVEIVTPSGAILPFEDELDHPIDLSQLAAPGAYRVRTTDASGTHELERAAFVLAPTLDESRLEREHVASDTPTAPATGHASRVRTRLGPWVFGLAGLLALAEAWARRPRARPPA